jgi:hypothetical protein
LERRNKKKQIFHNELNQPETQPRVTIMGPLLFGLCIFFSSFLNPVGRNNNHHCTIRKHHSRILATMIFRFFYFWPEDQCPRVNYEIKWTIRSHTVSAYFGQLIEGSDVICGFLIINNKEEDNDASWKADTELTTIGLND